MTAMSYSSAVQPAARPFQVACQSTRNIFKELQKNRLRKIVLYNLNILFNFFNFVNYN